MNHESDVRAIAHLKIVEHQLAMSGKTPEEIKDLTKFHRGARLLEKGFGFYELDVPT